MEKNKKKATEWGAMGGGELRKSFEFSVLPAMRFSLRLWLVRQWGGCCNEDYDAYGFN